MVRWTAVALSLIVTSVGESQTIGGVRLGFTTIQEVRRIRGVPDNQFVTEDGQARGLRYGQYAFYFGDDSVAVFARVFPTDSLSRTEFEAIFGKPQSERRDPDLTIRAVYADTVSASLSRSGRVGFIEYSMSLDTRLRRLEVQQLLSEWERSRYETLDTRGRTLRIGGTVSGALAPTDPQDRPGHYVQAWALPGTAGDSATIDLLSEDFDAFLRVVGPGLDREDDDGAGGCDARISVRLPQTAIYRVIVSSVGRSGGPGRYSLRVTRWPLPRATRECTGP